MNQNRFPRQASAATIEPLTLDMMRAHLRLDLINGAHPDDDSLVLYGKVAREAAERFTGCVFAQRDFVLALPGFPGVGFPIRIESFPVTEIASIVYRDSDGALQTLATADYELDVHSWPSEIDSLEAWPSTDPDRKNAVYITFTAGPVTADPRNEIPTQAISAMLLHVTELYGNRGDAPMPDAAHSLLQPLRIMGGL